MDFVWPGEIVPRPASMPGHEPCCGCGSDAISCERLSELTKVTLWPREIVTDDELTPDPVSVIVAPIGPDPGAPGNHGHRRGAGRPPAAAQETATRRLPTPMPAPMRRTEKDANADGYPCGGNQKNLREMLKPMNQEVLSTEPRAICPSVVPIPFEKFTWKRCPPARPSRPKLIRPTPGV